MLKRLFVVSNRLPLTIEHQNGTYECRQSSGGLVSAINSYLQSSGGHEFSETIWSGVPGCSEKIWQAAISSTPHGDYTYLPVFLQRKDYEQYYSGFSNSVVWPLFHYFPTYVDYNAAYFDAYIRVNEHFAEVLSAQLTSNDVVWIHDYHLLPLAGMLRKRMPGLTIGFFLHIPFPSYELFRVMPKPWQQMILTGMLGADLVGFHTVDYAAHFLNCAERVLKVQHDGQMIAWDNRQVRADAFPISIDFEQFNNAYSEDGVATMRDQYLQVKGDKKMVFSVDRLDYTKGLSNRLRGYEQFLQDNPDYMSKVIFVLVVVPSRDSITKYAERKKMIDEFIGSFNSRMGDISWQPVLYKYGHLSFDELMGLYTACDVALITPLRDGMNLVSKEFVASRKDKLGVLILSEMAGASKELTEALLINPNDTSEIADMIKAGFEMDPNEQQVRMAAMQDRISTYNVNTWAADFFEQLYHVKSQQLAFEIKFLDNASRIQLLDAYGTSTKRLLLLDYDGTLTPFAKLPSMAVPGRDVLDALQQLADNPANDVYIVSGRDANTLEEWLGALHVGLVAEHGAAIKHPDGLWEKTIIAEHVTWRPQIEAIMQNYVSKCPNSFIEQKEHSLAWHYRNADKVLGTLRARELYELLMAQTEGLSLNVLNGNKVIEVRMKGINKGMAAERLLLHDHYDFILSIGDDLTDEDMFKKLANVDGAYTIKVGNEASFAKYNLHTPQMVLSLLQTIGHYATRMTGV
ncbi:MAG: hypothetical protein BGO70_07205 [Bacteroidetes bacterium 43-93]|nr:bifunctional alpha,alpha-trehalose-phosphate synthase (UDP-forming)/trehalose-phosphatase [Bacteroidota bacterium]OJW97567.1 MAG: hypothetical protein BGO70_07205 [Bacteroidetes bacterium 43-93]